MAMPSASEVAARWVQQASGSGQRLVEGAQRFDGDPTALAAAQAQKAATNYSQSITSGRWQRGLAQAGRSGWLAGLQAKGATNYATGVQAAQSKYQAAMQTWLPITDSIATQVRSMPNNTIQDAANRAAQFAILMNQAKQNQ